MKNLIYPLLLVLLCTTKLPAQVCTLVDSFYINQPGTDTEHIEQTEAIAYSGGYLWIAATSDYERSYFAEYVNIYKYDLSGNRLDSIPYLFGVGEPFVALAGDGTYLWGLKFTMDSLYKIDIATKSIVTVYGMGGRGIADPGHTMASIGDTLYFIGDNAGKCFKFKKSTGVFIDYPTYTSHTGVYPSGMCAVGSTLITTTYLDLIPVSFDDVSVTNPGPFTENVSSRQNWCIDIPDGLTYGGSCFWQIKTAFITFDIRNSYVYKIHSSLSSYAAGVNNVANESDFVISPNPVSETINITYPEEIGWDVFSINLYSLTGAKILSQKASGSNGKVSIDISQLNLSAGMYYIQLSNADQQIMKKVCVF